MISLRIRRSKSSTLPLVTSAPDFPNPDSPIVDSIDQPGQGHRHCGNLDSGPCWLSVFFDDHLQEQVSPCFMNHDDQTKTKLNCSGAKTKGTCVNCTGTHFQLKAGESRLRPPLIWHNLNKTKREAATACQWMIKSSRKISARLGGSICWN